MASYRCSVVLQNGKKAKETCLHLAWAILTKQAIIGNRLTIYNVCFSNAHTKSFASCLRKALSTNQQSDIAVSNHPHLWMNQPANQYHQPGSPPTNQHNPPTSPPNQPTNQPVQRFEAPPSESAALMSGGSAQVPWAEVPGKEWIVSTVDRTSMSTPPAWKNRHFMANFMANDGQLMIDG